MFNPMPENACSAIAFPDPQEREPLVLAECSGPRCHNEVREGDDYRYDKELGLWFCCPGCLDAYRLKEGSVIRCCERGA